MTFLRIILLTFLYSCQNSFVNQKQTAKLPNYEIINDVLSSVIKIDSLSSNHSISRLLYPAKIYQIPFWPKDSMVPPPPPTPGGFYYHHLLEFLSSDNNIQRTMDSMFLSLQSERSVDILIADSIYSKFIVDCQHRYQFTVPIFSADLKKVYVQYWDNCGSLCGLCFEDVLHKTNTGWKRVERYVCGIK